MKITVISTNKKSVQIEAIGSSTGNKTIEVSTIGIPHGTEFGYVGEIKDIKGLPEALAEFERQLQALASQNADETKEVVLVATHADLSEVDDPTAGVIYITQDNNKLYIYNDTEDSFVEVTNQMIDSTIYVSNLNDLFEMTFENRGVFTVILTTHKAGAVISSSLSLVVNKTYRIKPHLGRVETTRLYLSTRDGWAEESEVEITPYAPETLTVYFDGIGESKVLFYNIGEEAWYEESNPNVFFSVPSTAVGSYVYDENESVVGGVEEHTEEQQQEVEFVWNWHYYSYEGHEHSIAEVRGLAQALSGKADQQQIYDMLTLLYAAL